VAPDSSNPATPATHPAPATGGADANTTAANTTGANTTGANTTGANTTGANGAAPDAAVLEVVRVRVPERSVRHDLRAIKIVWMRELIRFRTRGVSLRTFMFPGVIGMAVLFTAMFSAASIVWDREFGFLREMLVAPVSRGAIVFGKCLGGATVAAIQGLLVLCLAGLVGVPYSPPMILTLTLELLLLAFTLTAFGVMAAARIQQLQAFMALTQMFLMPMFFLSGALYPLSGLPAWLRVLTRINPLTYAIDPMRHAVFAHLQVSEAARQTLTPGVTWGGWRVPTLLELAIVAVMGLAMLGVAIAEFGRAE
jgi:ABC-2 type transport system permease protein